MTEQTFIALLKPFSDGWFRFILTMTGDEDFAKDCLQDTMLDFWKKNKTLNKIDDLNSYGFIIVRNKCYRHLKKQRHLSLDNVLQLVDNEAGEEAEINHQITGNFKEIILKVAADLPKRQREIFILKDIEGFDYEELELITGLKNTNIRANLSIARKTLREKLSKEMML